MPFATKTLRTGVIPCPYQAYQLANQSRDRCPRVEARVRVSDIFFDSREVVR
jgi:hypothetical protein